MINVNPSIHLDGRLLRSAIARATLAHGIRVDSEVRYDHDGTVAMADTIDRYRGDHAQALFQAMEQRGDSLPQGAGAMARQYEHIRAQIFEEKRRPLNAMRLFATDTSVPLGAKSYTSRRSLGQGEAVIHRGGNNFGSTARATTIEESHKVQYVVCAVETNEFEMFSSNFANTRQYERDIRLARRLVEEKLNEIAWYGDDAAGLTGVLNYPHLAKSVSPIEYTMATDAAAILKDLNRIVALPRNESGGTFRPNALAVAPDVYTVLSTRQHAAGTDTTIAEFFLRTQPSDGVKTIEVADELAGRGPNGEDAILAFSNDRDSLAHVLPQAPTILPVWKSSPLDSMTVLFAATGGVEMVDVGNHHLAFANASLSQS